MDLAVGDVWGVDGPHFPSLPEDEVGAFHRLPLSLQDFTPPAGCPGKKMELEVLGALLPAYPVAALAAVEEHLPVGENVLNAADRRISGRPSSLSLCLSASVSRLAALLACHKKYSLLRIVKL